MLVAGIWETLLKKGLVSEDFPEQVEGGAVENELELARTLIRQKKLAEKDLLLVFSELSGLPVISSIPAEEMLFELVRDIPIQYARRNRVFPFSADKDKKTVKVAICDPFDLEVINDLRVIFAAMRVSFVLAEQDVVLGAVNRTYGQGEDQETAEMIQDFGQENEQDLLNELEESSSDLLDDTSDAPVIKLVNHFIAQAIKAGASDIHIEPLQSELKIRFRLDGVLYNKLALSRKMHAAVVSRIKIMARLNIAEKRLPQDGRIEIKIGDREVDLRVSTIPTGLGERVVLRLLEKGIRLLKLHEIGLSADDLAKMRRMITISHGIVLVTGPTGSGKTTTLYAALNEINSPDKNILTIEDPIEYQLNGIGQMQTNSKIGLTFARGLRAMVRQDPDVILIGEIRDLETAEIAIQAALTGHLVFSTLHTNDSASAVTRLIDMGIEPFLVSSAVRAIIAQRLVRKVCPRCATPYTPLDTELKEWGIDSQKAKEGRFLKKNGCESCLETGYKGRSGIYEFLLMDDTLSSLILTTSDANKIRKKAVQRGMTSLREDGLARVLQGGTTVSEILRVTQV